MSAQNITNPVMDSIEREKNTYQRSYPMYKSVRIRHHNLERIKARATKYSQSIDDLITIILGHLEYYEKLGYDTPSEEKSF
jgi:hypothetical protein